MTAATGTAPPATAGHDHVWTVAAIAALAYIVVNAAHESIGHGAGLLLAGGRSGILTTTRLIIPKPLPSPNWRIFDLGGPAGNLVCAGLAWLGLRLFSRARAALHLFLWLTMAFSLYWAFGYLLFCGVTGRGDWMALLPSGGWPFRAVLFVAGFALYRLSSRLAARELRGFFDASASGALPRARHLMWTAWFAGGIIATAGAAFDPRGSIEMLNSGALSSFAAAVGLLWIPPLLARSPYPPQPAHTSTPLIVARSAPWIASALVASFFFIGVLGRGISWRL
jgi:hypothetical protein